MAARARATGPLTGSGPKKWSASAETRGVAAVVKRKYTSRAQKNPPRPAGKQDASLSSYQLAPHRVVREEPRETHRRLPSAICLLPAPALVRCRWYDAHYTCL